MGFCNPPALISTDAPIFDPEHPGFEDHVGQELGDIAGFFDGLDAILAGPLGSLSDDMAVLQALGDVLDLARFSKGVYDAAVIAPLLAEFAALQVSGDAMVLATLAQIAGGPAVPTAPDIPQQPDPGTITVGTSSPGTGGGGGGGVEPTPGEPGNHCPGYGFIQGPCVPIDAAPTLPGPTPTPTGPGDCLNPTPGGGFAPGPCPVEPGPQPQPAPQPPDPAPAPAPEPAPEPDPGPAPAPEPEPAPDPDPAPEPLPPDSPPPFYDSGGGGGGGNAPDWRVAPDDEL